MVSGGRLRGCLQFAPTYHDYVLYSDGTQEAPRRYRTRTFVPTGQEMGTHRQPKGGFFAANAPRTSSASVASDVEGGGVATSSPGESSEVAPNEHDGGGLLFDAHLTQSTPYDMAPIMGDQGEAGETNEASDKAPRGPPMNEQFLADSSQSDKVGEETRLTKEKRMASGGHDMLVHEIDVNGAEDFDAEGYVQR